MSEEKTNFSDDFRNHLSTVSKSGKRNWVYAKQPKGFFYSTRTFVSVILLAVFFLLPFLRLGDSPVFLFNVLERRFVFFGITFWPQDFFIFGLGMITFLVFILLFTVVYGRVFCGWICPQTIFLEMIFRRIEYWIEGNYNKQKNIDAGSSNFKKDIKKTIKHLIFFLIAFMISNTFLAYLIGTDTLFLIMSQPLSMHIGGFLSILVFSFLFYGVFAFMREQVCIAICPYGRLQGVLLDKDTAVVAYDYVRGEKRQKFKKNENRTAGDCIDCHQCVLVCPTGIDIRNGTQLECVNCTACIDSCNFMMKKVGLPPNLIRFASENSISEGKPFKITIRAKAYSFVLILLLGFMSFLLYTRKDIQSNITRAGGFLYQKQGTDSISNLYNIKLVNKTQKDAAINLKLESGFKGTITMVGKHIDVPAEQVSMGMFFIVLPLSEIHKRSEKLEVGVYKDGKKIDVVKTTFLGPG